jgi:hypothetical protein
MSAGGQKYGLSTGVPAFLFLVPAFRGLPRGRPLLFWARLIRLASFFFAPAFLRALGLGAVEGADGGYLKLGALDHG